MNNVNKKINIFSQFPYGMNSVVPLRYFYGEKDSLPDSVKSIPKNDRGEDSTPNRERKAKEFKDLQEKIKRMEEAAKNPIIPLDDMLKQPDWNGPIYPWLPQTSD